MDAALARAWGQGIKRVDLHCHSRASTETDEAVLLAIRCPESYSEPADIYKMAKERGMDFVAITDHDSIAGATELIDRPNMIIGEELTCYFPEDHCKIHLLLWGITHADHLALQEVAADIYKLATRVVERNLAHAVAHPLYRQNNKLDRWHIERLLLLFNGFECLNGAHSASHREAFEPMLDKLDAQEICRLERVHLISAQGTHPCRKTRTGGSDDHGLFNIGRTWTEFPADVRTTGDLLQALRDARCRPGGEAGSSIKLAHNFYGVGIRYYLHNLAPTGKSLHRAILHRLVGERSRIPTLSLFAAGTKVLINKAASKAGFQRRRRRGTKLLSHLLSSGAKRQFPKHQALLGAMRHGKAPLAEHETMFSLISALDRETTAGIAGAITSALDDGEIGEIIDAVSAVLAQHAILLPYYFALFHQNQERDLLRHLTRNSSNNVPRVGFFTDAFDGSSSASVMARAAKEFASIQDVRLTVHTCSAKQNRQTPAHRNFAPVWTPQIKRWPEKIMLPPLLEILQFADEKQFDLIVVNTCGPMGLCGLVAAKMLQTPVLAICNEDVASQIFARTDGDYRLTGLARSYTKWFMSRAAKSQCSDIDSLWNECLRMARAPQRDLKPEFSSTDSVMEVAQ
jgi:predicted metal-dependent phosphoesterase TrpH